MVKVVTQETFDEYVRENMEEFDMSKEEAIQEAKDQLLTQVGSNEKQSTQVSYYMYEKS